MFRLFAGVLLCALVLSGEAWGVHSPPAKPRPGKTQVSGIGVADTRAESLVAMKPMRSGAVPRRLQLIHHARHRVLPMGSRHLEGLSLTLLQRHAGTPWVCVTQMSQRGHTVKWLRRRNDPEMCYQAVYLVMGRNTLCTHHCAQVASSRFCTSFSFGEDTETLHVEPSSYLTLRSGSSVPSPPHSVS